MNMFTPDKEAEWEKLTNHLCIPSPRVWDYKNQYRMRLGNAGIFKIKGRIEMEEPEPFLFEVNDAISYSLEDISEIQSLQDIYSSIPYTIERSIDLLKQSVENLSKDFGNMNIPFVYSTQILPASSQYPSSIWSELKSMTEYFDENRFGRLNFIGAILAMKKKGVIELLSFEFLYVDDNVLVMKVCIKYIRKDTVQIVSTFESTNKISAVTLEKLSQAKDWKHIRFEFNEDANFVDIFINDHRINKYHFEELGFLDQRGGGNSCKAVRSWELLKMLSSFPNGMTYDVNQQKVKSALQKKLHALFPHLLDSPIICDSKKRQYTVSFSLLHRTDNRNVYLDNKINTRPKEILGKY